MPNHTGDWLIVQGDPVDGYTFIGPFPDIETATEYAEPLDYVWWLAPLYAPLED